MVMETIKEEYPCPSCGFLVFDEPPGSYGLCGICGWEDDNVQLSNWSSGGGANGESLAESQQKILKEHPLSVKELDGVKRDTKWRPLSNEEMRQHQEEVEKSDSLWPRKGISDAKDSYWLR
jgi:hypothetical protein